MHGFIVLMLSYTSVVNTCLVIKITQVDANAYLELFVIVVSNLTASFTSILSSVVYFDQ